MNDSTCITLSVDVQLFESAAEPGVVLVADLVDGVDDEDFLALFTLLRAWSRVCVIKKI